MLIANDSPQVIYTSNIKFSEFSFAKNMMLSHNYDARLNFPHIN